MNNLLARGYTRKINDNDYDMNKHKYGGWWYVYVFMHLIDLCNRSEW